MHRSISRTVKRSRLWTFRVGAVALAVASVVSTSTPAYAVDLPTGTRRVSVASDGTQATYLANEGSFNLSLSANDRFVAFDAFGTGLVPNDTNGQRDVFVHDRVTGVTTRVSVASDGSQAVGGESTRPNLTADGRRVAFSSDATNLVPTDINGVSDVFVHNRVTGVTTRVSVASDGSQAVGGGSFRPSLDAFGLTVAFGSDATNLVPTDTNGVSDVFVHDLQTGQTTRVSVQTGGAEATGGASSRPASSADGRFVAFQSLKTNLVPGGTTAGRTHVYRHDRLTQTTVLVSVATDAVTEGDSGSGFFDTDDSLAISADGRFVAFSSAAANLVANDTNGLRDVFVRDMVAGVTTRVSVASGGAQGTVISDPADTPTEGSNSPALSADGRFVAFMSRLRDIVPGGNTGSRRHVFVHDRLTSTTTRVSVRGDLVPGNGSSRRPSISADGRIVSFSSFSDNLVPNDTNGNGVDSGQDIFVAGLPVGPTWFVTGAGAGGGSHVRGLDALGGGSQFNRFAYDPTFLGGARVALGDVTGDGIPDVITGAGPGGGPHVKVFDGAAGAEIRSFFAYDASFTGGVFVAAGDVNGDGTADIITGAGAGGGPHVKVFDGATGAVIRSFFAYDAGFTGGVFVAAGDVNGDGKADIVTGAGAGGGPHVKVFDGVNGDVIRSFFAYDAGFTGGVRVAAGDVTGDGTADIVTGAGAGGGPHVKVFDGATGAEIRGFFAYDAGFTGGVFVGAVDLNIDGKGDIITGAGAGGGPHVRIFDGATGLELFGFFSYSPLFVGGVFVGGP